jgi:multimeric flavodoxin WrbA
MLFQAGRKRILGCIACQTCFSKGTDCSFKDDFNEVAPMFESADIIVFCTPIYLLGISIEAILIVCGVQAA